MLPLEAFYPRHKRNNLSPTCKTCDAKRVKVYRQSARGRASEKQTRTSPQGKARQKKYRLSPKGKAAMARKRALRRMVTHHGENLLTALEWEAIKARAKNRCYYCQQIPEELTIDHIIPLSKGGKHTASNVVPACRPCNSRKHNHRVLLL
jgi:5-methylcytosine-specific restriction endonuclease McrA